MRIHFIAIGGAAMHNLALALHEKGFVVSGSDDEIFEPSRSRLDKRGLLPSEFGWFPAKITNEIDAVILGMHARIDNPELLAAQKLGLKVFSYPEFLYEQTKDKKRVVIGGSHGKTTITSMIMHVLRKQNMKFDYMVGAQIEGFDTMVSLSDDADIAIFEGDEYLSSPIDRRPKFHLYKPHIALINGIGWDHINVFPTFENYLEQFDIFINKIETEGSLFYFSGDKNTTDVIEQNKRADILRKAYSVPVYEIREGLSYLKVEGKEEVPLEVFGEHNLQNLEGARMACNAIGVDDEAFYSAISTFSGSAKRLQRLHADEAKIVFTDFAHSPSKVEGTINAVKQQYSNAEVIAVFELHTFSSLTKEFLTEYKGSLDAADKAFVFYNPEVVKHKKLQMVSPEDIVEAFGNSAIEICLSSKEVQAKVKSVVGSKKQVFVFMSSGNFGGMMPEDMVDLIVN